MNVSYKFYRWLELKEDWLIGEDVLGGEAEIDDVLLTDLDILISISLLSVDSNFLVLLDVETPNCIDDPVSYQCLAFHCSAFVPLIIYKLFNYNNRDRFKLLF